MAKGKELANQALDAAVDGMVDAVMKQIEEGYDNPLMPFEAYVAKTREEMKKDAHEFRLRLRKGYLAILHALIEKKNIKTEDKKKILKHIITRNINTLSGDFRIYP